MKKQTVAELQHLLAQSNAKEIAATNQANYARAQLDMVNDRLQRTEAARDRLLQIVLQQAENGIKRDLTLMALGEELRPVAKSLLALAFPAAQPNGAAAG